MPAREGLRVKYVPLAELKPAARNPKDHDIGAIIESLRRFGFVAPGILNEATGRIVVGHGRAEALAAMKNDGEDPPGRIAKKNGDWMVPIIHGISFKNDEEAEAYLLADNRLTELGGWDDAQLAGVLSEFAKGDVSLSGVGFNEDDLETLMRRMDRERGVDDPPEPKIDHASALQEKWCVERGQIWMVGEHRLMCGDAMSPEDVSSLLSGAKPGLLVTDPPYGVELDMEWRDRAGKNKHGAAEPSYMKVRAEGHQNTRISGDSICDWSAAFELVPSLQVGYVWHASGHAIEVGLGLERIGFEIRQMIIWLKPQFVFSRTHYHYQTEPCYYVVRKGSTAKWIGPHNQSNVWEAASPKMIMSSSDEEKKDHPTQKPFICSERPIGNHDFMDVYEPFAGSGTTIAACERHRRRCFAMEIDPRYVAVALQRLADMGLEPQLKVTT